MIRKPTKEQLQAALVEQGWKVDPWGHAAIATIYKGESRRFRLRYERTIVRIEMYLAATEDRGAEWVQVLRAKLTETRIHHSKITFEDFTLTGSQKCITLHNLAKEYEELYL